VSRIALSAVAALAALAGSPSARAVQSCELNGQHVNPDNGSTTEGKTGLMRCRDGEGGPVLREQELQQGKFMGLVRYYKDGALEKEFRVNERGNRDGLAREWARAEPGAKPVLVREETLRDSRTVGLARSWYPSGVLRRVSPQGALPEVYRFNDVEVNIRSNEVLRAGTPIELSAKEFALLAYFISHPAETLSRDRLLDEVWGYENYPNTTIVNGRSDLPGSCCARKRPGDPDQEGVARCSQQGT